MDPNCDCVSGKDSWVPLTLIISCLSFSGCCSCCPAGCAKCAQGCVCKAPQTESCSCCH
uniref:Metallothionein n=1 Tax=Monodelphis domestica TaxID=13616 RepID=F7G3P8_MONDO